MGAEARHHLVAKYRYIAQADHELSLHEGERVLLVDDSKEWWMVEAQSGERGFVPSNYVRRVGGGFFHSLKNRLRSIGSNKSSSSNGSLRHHSSRASSSDGVEHDNSSSSADFH